jgi:SWI/SNF-related matrix-associated actin-dependent regulator 1 of chromatin subfamily A
MAPWDLLVCDEAHALKSWSSKQTKNIILIVARACDRVWLLTGTPATRSAADYHPILSVIEPGVHGKFKEFANKFCLSKPGFGYPGAVQYYGFKNTDELKEKVRKVGLRRLKKDVLKQLPGKIYTDLPIVLDDRELSVEDYVNVTEAFSSGKPDESLAAQLHQLGLEKVSNALDWINGMDEPLVVFAWHRDVIDALVAGCNRNCAAIHGGVSAEHKQKIVDDFQKKELDVLFLNIAAGGVGITLTRSNHVLFVEPTWSPALMLQAEDRVHRIGQAAECVNVYHLVAMNTVDELVFRNLKMKEIGINAVIKSE